MLKNGLQNTPTTTKTIIRNGNKIIKKKLRSTNKNIIGITERKSWK